MAKNDSDAEGFEDEGEEREWKQWPEAKAAAAQLEITQRQLIQYVRSNKLSRWRAPDGSWRYRPEELEKLRDRIMGADDAPAFEGHQASIADVLAANVALLTQAQNFIEQLMKNVTQPMAKGIEFLTEISRQQNERIDKLQGAYDIAIATKERLLTEEELRNLMRSSEGSKERRKGEAWQLLMAQGPKLLQQLGESFVAKNPEALAAAKLINSLDPTFVEAFAESDMLDLEQKTLLKVIIARNAAKRAAEKATAAKAAGANPPANDAKARETPPDPSPSPPSPPAPEATVAAA